MANKFRRLFFAIAIILFFIPIWVVVAQVEDETLMNVYIDSKTVSLLQNLFIVATSPDVMIMATIIAIISFIGIIYLSFGFILFLFLNKKS